jgi:hypothetical protein
MIYVAIVLKCVLFCIVVIIVMTFLGPAPARLVTTYVQQIALVFFQPTLVIPLSLKSRELAKLFLGDKL